MRFRSETRHCLSGVFLAGRTGAEWSAWSGTYEYSDCVESWARDIPGGSAERPEIACDATEVKTRTKNGPWGEVTISMEACPDMECTEPTEECEATQSPPQCDAIRFKSGLVVGTECEFELGYECVPPDAEPGLSYYIGNYSL